MANTTRIEKVLGTICFTCCKKSFSGLPGTQARQNRHPELGSRVELNGACSGCPVAEIRGDGAPISAGQRDKFFGNLIPGKECDQKLTSTKAWLPCEVCGHATVFKKNGNKVISLKDPEFCCLHCAVKEIRDCIEEAEAAGN